MFSSGIPFLQHKESSEKHFKNLYVGKHSWYIYILQEPTICFNSIHWCFNAHQGGSLPVLCVLNQHHQAEHYIQILAERLWHGITETQKLRNIDLCALEWTFKGQLVQHEEHGNRLHSSCKYVDQGVLFLVELWVIQWLLGPSESFSSLVGLQRLCICPCVAH